MNFALLFEFEPGCVGEITVEFSQTELSGSHQEAD